MTQRVQTAYPKLEAHFTYAILSARYHPTENERQWAASISQPIARLGFLVQLKLVQRLGYFLSPAEAPSPIIEHIRKVADIHVKPTPEQWANYQRSGTRQRHITQIRQHHGIRRFTQLEHGWLRQVAETAALTKEAITDIINVMLEELVHHRFELPGLSVLERQAQQSRQQVNDQLYAGITTKLSTVAKKQLDRLLSTQVSSGTYSDWQRLKREPKKPTNKAIRSYLHHVEWLRTLETQMPTLSLPTAKYRQFMLEARALDAKEMRDLRPNKRYALAVILIRSQHGQALDDVAELFIKLIRGLERQAQDNLQRYILQQQAQTNELIGTLRDMLLEMDTPGSAAERLKRLDERAGPDKEALMAKCDEHLAYSGNNYYPFLLRPYRTKRSLLFNCLSILTLRSTSSDKTTERLIRCLLSLRDVRQEHIDTRYVLEAFDGVKGSKWLSTAWKKLVLGPPKRDDDFMTFHRKYLELCILLHIKQELASVDLYVVNSEQYKDYRKGLIDEATYARELPRYAQQVELPLEKPGELIQHLKSKLARLAQRVDERFPENTYAQIKEGRISLKRLLTQRPGAAIQRVDDAISQQLEPTSIVDILVDSERWLNLSDLFYPLSGQQSRVDDPARRFVTTLFCYGCNLGPTQTARSIKGISPKQVAWLNLKQVTDDRLDKAIANVINAYNQFDLPRFWGSGQHASVDGTKWELYEQNLMSEYHIRYGGYGGIGYYHVSDTYIALYSHFLSCGAYEGNYLIDGLLNNQSEIQPEFLHGDTQSQSYPVFGLSYLLGIQLMPRIRNIHDLNLFRPDKTCRYEHIDQLFAGSIDFALIEQLLPDMLKIILSIKLGRMPASSLLRRLGTYSRKNKLYFAFRELGKVIRTLFLLNYIDNVDLRQVIQSETNKSEEFNGFIKWLFFGGEGVIAQNVRHEQSKIVKYNHLVANMVVLYNTERMTRVLKQLMEDGTEITADIIAGLSPYRTAHINRFGDYILDMNRQALRPDYRIEVLNKPSDHE